MSFLDIFSNKYIYIPVLLWFLIQCYKIVCDLVTTKKFNFRRIMGAGGMPSSHSAVVCSLATLVGRSEGFASPIFAVTFVLAVVVMYDAAGIRRAAGKQAKMLNKIVNTPGLTNVEIQEKLVEVLGHTPFQVFIGALIGVIVGAIF